MRNSESNLRNVAWLAVANVVTKVAWALCLMLLMHSLGSDGYGQLATLWAVAGLLAAFTDLGAGQVVLRLGSRQPGQLLPAFHRAFWIKTVVTVVLWVCAVVIGLALLASSSEDSTTQWAFIILATGAMLVDHFHALCTFVLQIRGRMDLHAYWRSAGFVVLLIAFAVVAMRGAALVEFAASQFVITVCFVTGYLLSTLRLLRGAGADQAPPVRAQRLIVEGAPFAVIAMLNLAYCRLETILLATIGSTAAAAVYHGQYQVILLMYNAPAILLTVLMPALYQATRESGYLERSFFRVSRYLNLLAWLTVPVLVRFAGDIMLIVGGRDFALQPLTMQVLAGMIFLMPLTVALEFLIAVDQMRFRIVSEASAILIIVVGGIITIGPFGAPGMAAVAVLGFAVSGCMAVVRLHALGIVEPGPVLRNFLWTGLLVAPAVAAFWIPFVPWWLRCVAFLVAAGVTLTVGRYWNDEDRQFLRQFLRQLRPGFRRS